MPLNTPATDAGKPGGKLPFVLGGLSFIPLVGIVFGLIAIGWGLISKRPGGKTLALLGLGGIGFTALVYGGLLYFGFVQRGGIYDSLRARMAQSELNSLVQSVEFYKLRFGEYPESLVTLKASLPNNSLEAVRYVFDPRISGLGPPSYFYYRRVDPEHYYLRGVAPDGDPFSPGALVPQFATTGTRLGLVTEPPPGRPARGP